MIDEDVEDDMTCFVDIDMNAFMAVVFILKKDVMKLQIAIEVRTILEKGDLWTMFFDGDFCKDGSRAGILLISPTGITYKFSFTSSFPCNNKIAEYEALLL